ncbi:MAG: hypothetical protein COA78_04655 [Blastopirellula sp.]|nr:MAG: hypothetical protein COA78_04655 [Blastopirellula sp.]
MQNEPLNFDQSLFEAELAELVPSGAAINRDALMFEAGQVEAGRKTNSAVRKWATLCGMLACVSLVQTGFLLSSNDPEVPIANHNPPEPETPSPTSLAVVETPPTSVALPVALMPQTNSPNFKPAWLVKNSNAWFRNRLLYSGNPFEEIEPATEPTHGSVLPVTRTHRELLNELLKG